MSQHESSRVALATEVFGNPAALFTALGSRSPLHRVTLPDGQAAVMVTGNREAREALNDPRLVRSIEAAAPELRMFHPLAHDEYKMPQHMLFADPPNHARLRRLVSKAFTRPRVKEMRARVQEITDELIDVIAPKGSADLVPTLTQPLSVAVISEMLGVPAQDRAEFAHHATLMTGINAFSDFAAVIAANQWLDASLTELAARRRVEPADDLLSAMVAAQVDDDQLTDLEVKSNALLLLIAGFETTMNLIANGIVALLTHPEALAALRADPSLMPNAVDEMLRYDPPGSTVTYYYAAERTEIAGFAIEPGEQVVISVAAANHDPAVFTDPSRFDIHRNTGQMLSFSHGIHFCLGAPLARLEAEVAFTTVLRRLPDLALAVPVQELTWNQSYHLHRMDALPVTFTV
ncbi:cytochrome P450 [Allocatelliglobosispora scoriae]|uniref:Cytochrome P450 n=1 Tax=Allocatelliglobosispora scoriae TaxID=643052 RepID=A0A841C1I2_9ACTN|nr:cytochrome P450 [Allocatelliglobosispora scoriae]MBB5873608.1 cytochrome P450 [Allocatelliglobosispora scoriae]